MMRVPQMVPCVLVALLACVAPVIAQDTIVVRADNPPKWGANVRVVRELRIGELDGAEEYTFGRVNSIAIDRQGAIFALDAQARTVRQFTAAGRYVRSFGRRGQGPGELANPEAIAIADDRLVVRDTRNGRFVLYALAGGEPEHWAYQKYSSSSYAIIVHPDGGLSTPFKLPASGRSGSREAIMRYQRDGSADTIEVPRFGPSAPMVTASSGRTSVSYSIPYQPGSLWTSTSRGVVIGGYSGRYALVVVEPQRIRRIERPAPARVPVSEAERQALITEIAGRIRESVPGFRWNGPSVPAVKPYYKAIWVDADDRIWVHLSAPSRRVAPTAPAGPPTWIEPPIHDVFSGAGRYLGRVRFPDEFVLFHADGEHVWGTERDELGVQYVVRYRLLIPRRVTTR